MRILVIGRNGQLARSLLAAPGGHMVTAVGRGELDLSQARGMREALAAHAPQAVINAAAYTAVDKAESEPEAAFAVNAHGAGALAEATAALGIPLIHVSTDYVFDGRKSGPYREHDATGPLGTYGASKLAGETLVARHNSRHVIVRTSWVVSPYGANFCKTMLRLAATRDELRVVADQHGAPTYAADLAGALLALATAAAGLPVGDPRFGIYHLANAGEASWADVAEATLMAAARHGGRVVPVRRITTAEYPTPARRPANSRLDCSRIRGSFGIALPPWQAAVARCVDAIMREARRASDQGG